MTEHRSAPVDGFTLAYERSGVPGGPAVVLLHGWPGRRTDYREVVPLLRDADDVLVPDLRGFGASDRHDVAPGGNYDAAAQARSVLGLMDELGLAGAVLAGYDVGGRVAQAVARAAPERVRALVLAPPLPGAGERVLEPGAQREFWYQPFHRLELSSALIDGDARAVRAYLKHFWDHWSGPGFVLTDADLDALVATYAPPGAFAASIAWYRAGSGTIATSLAERDGPPPEPIAVPTRVLWPEHDPLFPVAWSDRAGTYFSDVTIATLPCGHFAPLEAPEEFAAAVREALASYDV